MTEERTKAKIIDTAEPITALAQRLENLQPNPRLDSALSYSAKWPLEKFYGLKRLYKVIPITVDLEQGDTIFYQRNSPDLVQGIFPEKINRSFGLFKYTLVFDIEIQSTFQQVGVLNALFDPRYTTGQGAVNSATQSGTKRLKQGYPISLYLQTLFPHSFMTLGHNGNYQFRLPWLSNRSTLPTLSDSTKPNKEIVGLANYNMGQFLICIFQPMLIAEGVNPSASMRIWVSLDNVELSAFTGNVTL